MSIAFLKEHDYFCGYQSGLISWTNWHGEQTASICVTICTADGENYARFQYTDTRRSTGVKTECDYKVQLVTTPCHLGGVRWWFICPLSRNEPRHGRLAHMGRFLTLDKRREKLLEGMARWTYRGRPTRKARRLHALEVQMAAYGKAHLPDLM